MAKDVFRSLCALSDEIVRARSISATTSGRTITSNPPKRSKEGKALAYLTKLRERLIAIKAEKAVILLDPIAYSILEVDLKMMWKPQDLSGSSKLFRVIDNIENFALKMPEYHAHQWELGRIVNELREITGWTPTD